MRIMLPQITRHIDCLFKSLFRVIATNHHRFVVLTLCDDNLPVTGGFPSQRVNNSEVFPWHCPRGKILGPPLTHWGRLTHICVGKPTTIGSDNDWSTSCKIPLRSRHFLPQKLWHFHKNTRSCVENECIIWTNAGILLIRPLRTNFNEMLIEIQTFSFKEMHLKMSFAKWRPFVSASMC